MTKRKSLIPSKEMRMHYNFQLRQRLAHEIPNTQLSQHVAEIRVRAQWGNDSSDPNRIVVIVERLDGKKVRFKEKLYGFPSETLVAKLGLLL